VRCDAVGEGAGESGLEGLPPGGEALAELRVARGVGHELEEQQAPFAAALECPDDMAYLVLERVLRPGAAGAAGGHLGLIAAPLESSWRGRTQRGDLLIGTSLRQLSRRHGVDLRGRAADAREHAVSFEDGSELDVETVIWATGFRSDYSWIHAPVLDAHGAPVHQRGVTGSPGLFFLGMKNQYSRGSSLIAWVRHDAAYIIEHIRGTRARA
jgi:hypothetical protein